MKRVGTLKANILGAAMIGIAAFTAGPALADTGTTLRWDSGTTAVASANYSAESSSTDYGRGTTRSDNSPGNAGGLS